MIWISFFKQIEINSKLSGVNILQTLAHEIVHVKQYIRGETDECLSHWKGIKVDTDRIEYFSYPWEIEANGVETGLFTNFVINEKLWEVFDNIQNPLEEIKKEPFGWKNI